MTKTEATAVADALGGEPRHTEGGWVVVIHKNDGQLVVIAAGEVCLYDRAADWPDGPNCTGIFWH